MCIRDSRVPNTFEELLALPGVGRKSANLIMGDVFGKPAIEAMMAQAGHPVFDADGILQKGVILRHLALPGLSLIHILRENLDILSQKNILETENHRILVEDMDEGEVLRERVHDLKQ